MEESQNEVRERQENKWYRQGRRCGIAIGFEKGLVIAAQRMSRYGLSNVEISRILDEERETIHDWVNKEKNQKYEKSVEDYIRRESGTRLLIISRDGYHEGFLSGFMEEAKAYLDKESQKAYESGFNQKYKVTYEFAFKYSAKRLSSCGYSREEIAKILYVDDETVDALLRNEEYALKLRGIF